MNIETIREFACSLPAVQEDIKWGNDLCFTLAGKMFCVVGLNEPLTVSFKVPDEEFEEIAALPGFIPAPYVARYKWVQVTDITRLNQQSLERYIVQSYQLIKGKLPKKALKEIGLE